MNTVAILDINWTELSTKADIAVALIALLSLVLNFYLIRNNKKERKEDIRARLSFSIINWHGFYMLRIANVGKETAYHINLNVTGKPIIENLYPFVRSVFEKLSKMSFCLEAGKDAYYLISPDESSNRYNGLEGDLQLSSSKIQEWLQEYDDEDIHITGKYCDKYKVQEDLSIREYLIWGSFEHKDAIEYIADSLLSRDPKVKSIQNNIDLIAKAIGSKNKQ